MIPCCPELPYWGQQMAVSAIWDIRNHRSTGDERKTGSVSVNNNVGMWYRDVYLKSRPPVLVWLGGVGLSDLSCNLLLHPVSQYNRIN